MIFRKAADLKTGPGENTSLGYLVPKNKESAQGIIGTCENDNGSK